MQAADAVDILLVDDKADNLLALEAILKLPGYNLIKARSGAEALSYLLDHDCAIILLDVQMPEMDGFETASIIKQSRRSREIPIIFITAISKDERYVHRGYNTGAVDYVFKPLDPEILRAKVAVFADLFRSKQEIARQAELLRENDRKELARQLAQVELRNVRREQASQVKYQQLVNGIENGIIWSAEPSTLIFSFVSPSAETILGFPLSFWSDQPNFWSQHIHPEDKNRFFQALSRLKSPGDAIRVEHRFLRADRTVVWFQSALRLETKLDNEQVELRGLSVVITKIKEAEEASRRNAERAQFLAEANLVLSESFEYEGALRKIGRLIVPKFADGYAVSLLDDHREIRLLSVIGPNSQMEQKFRELLEQNAHTPIHINSVQQAFNGKPAFYRSIPDEALKASGADRDSYLALEALGFRSSINVPIISRGRTIGAIAIVRGDSAYALDEADVAMVQDLAHRAGLTIENAILHREAKEAIRARDEFLSIASHELKTPLTPLMLQTQSLIKKIRQGLRAEGRPELFDRTVQSLDRQVRRLSQLVDELLDVSRINVGQLGLQIQQVDLKDVVKEVVERICNDSMENICPVEFAAESSAVGQWDSFRIEQVVTNLLTNAIKYSDGKPVKISVSADGNTAKLIVQDHGLGIAKDDQQRIFERFERAVSPSHFGGLGLGLYIAKAIVDSHAGSIRVESELGQGSTFIVELPLVPANQSHGAAA